MKIEPDDLIIEGKGLTADAARIFREEFAKALSEDAEFQAHMEEIQRQLLNEILYGRSE